MKAIGVILFIIGLLGCIYFGIQALDDSETFSLFGIDMVLSKANWTPLIVSAIVLIVGVFMARSKQKSRGN